LEAVKYFVEKGADVNAENNSGQTPLDYAKTEKIQEFLRSSGGSRGLQTEY
jgi:ankyrin repeat protein